MANVLIVDDSLVMRKTLKNLLSEAGFTIVGEAEDGEKAINKFEETMPDFVTMDVNMPKMDGIDATRQIIEMHPDAKIIMISAISDKARVVEAIKNGAKNYILKPVTMQKLMDVIHKLN